MQIVHGYDKVPVDARRAVLAIGNFDGVHRGHRTLLDIVRRIAGERGVPAGVLVFEPHPRALFRPDKPHFTLTPLDEKLALLERYGVDLTVVLGFDRRFAELSAAEFVERVLVAGLGVSHVVVGYDFHYGKARAGGPATLVAAGKHFGFGVDVVDQVADQGEVVSSSAIRAELAQGGVTGAADLLGHWWRVSGTVVGGAKRGTGMGYPTANIALAKGTALAHGIYAVRVDVDGESHAGAAYLGTRPTFDNGEALLETFLLDFDGDIYGRRIAITFIGFVRGDRKFDSSDDLVAQMDLDVARVRTVLAAAKA